jgi:hypothetical protein
MKHCTTKVLAKATLDIVISAIRKHQQRFGLDVQFSALVLDVNNIFFNWAFVPGWTSNEFPAFAKTGTLPTICIELVKIMV